MPKSALRRGGSTPGVRPWYRRVNWPQALLWAVLITCSALSWTMQVDIAEVPPESAGWWIFQGDRYTIMHRVGIGSVVAQALIALVATEIAAMRVRRARQDEQERLTESRDTMLTLVSPLNGHIARLAELKDGDETTRERIMGEATSTTLAELCNFFGGSLAGIRVCLWTLDEHQAPRTLVPTHFHGAGRLAACKLAEADGGVGERFFYALDHRRIISWHDGNPTEHPAGWSPNEYHRAFVAVAVGTHEKLYGMITLNAGDPNAFGRDQDQRTIQLVAEQYATCLSVYRRVARKARSGRVLAKP